MVKQRLEEQIRTISGTVSQVEQLQTDLAVEKDRNNSLSKRLQDVEFHCAHCQKPRHLDDRMELACGKCRVCRQCVLGRARRSLGSILLPPCFCGGSMTRADIAALKDGKTTTDLLLWAAQQDALPGSDLAYKCATCRNPVYKGPAVSCCNGIRLCWTCKEGSCERCHCLLSAHDKDREEGFGDGDCIDAPAAKAYVKKLTEELTGTALGEAERASKPCPQCLSLTVKPDGPTCCCVECDNCDTIFCWRCNTVLLTGIEAYAVGVAQTNSLALAHFNEPDNGTKHTAAFFSTVDGRRNTECIGKVNEVGVAANKLTVDAVRAAVYRSPADSADAAAERAKALTLRDDLNGTVLFTYKEWKAR